MWEFSHSKSSSCWGACVPFPHSHHMAPLESCIRLIWDVLQGSVVFLTCWDDDAVALPAVVFPVLPLVIGMAWLQCVSATSVKNFACSQYSNNIVINESSIIAERTQTSWKSEVNECKRLDRSSISLKFRKEGDLSLRSQWTTQWCLIRARAEGICMVNWWMRMVEKPTKPLALISSYKLILRSSIANPRSKSAQSSWWHGPKCRL